MKTTREQYVVDRRGKRTGVILSSEQYDRMVEDMHDLAVLAERREEKPISAAEMTRRLERHGRL